MTAAVADAGRISMVTAVRNSASTLQRELDSVFEQTYGDIETHRHRRRVDQRDEQVLERNDATSAYSESAADGSVYPAGTRRWTMYRRLDMLPRPDDRFHDPGSSTRHGTRR